MGISTFVLALNQLIEHPLCCRRLSVSKRAHLQECLQAISSQGDAIAFLRQHFALIMSLPWQRTDILSELCGSFSPSELEEASIFLGVDRIPAGFQGTGCLVNTQSIRQMVDHPAGAHMSYFGNWLVHATEGVVEAYDYSHVINEGHCEVVLHDVAYLTQPDRVYYMVADVLQEGQSDYDQLRQNGLKDGCVQTAIDAIPAAFINLSESYLNPLQYSGDVLIDENDRWALVYNHYMGGAYTLLSKVKESVICASLSLDMMPRRLSRDVRQLLRTLVADNFVAFANGQSGLPLLMEGRPLQVVYNRERDGFVVHGAFADRPYDSVPFFWKYDYKKSMEENLKGLRQGLEGCVSSIACMVDIG